ncbi:MAG: Tat pathway signal protein [Parafilimonas terrae]|nr:Tat pathway signal protein [Parafilimonas terrae]
MRSWSTLSSRGGLGRVLRGAVLPVAMSAALVLPASAQDGGGEKQAPIKLQLNKAETAGDACRMTLVVDNSRGGALKSYKVDLFAFDSEGVAQKRVAVELGPIPPRKTTVKIFDFAGIACAKVGRVLLNDVLACEGDTTREACLERTETDSKATIPFDR